MSSLSGKSTEVDPVGTTGAVKIRVVPSFHYDVAYLKPAGDYLPVCFRNLDEALEILEASPDYTFLIEQTFLLERYWEARPQAREKVRRLAREGRISVAPGMYVMPDLNHCDGESLVDQMLVGREWLAGNLGVEPTICWIADCWGHHAQLPQILSKCGYAGYVFWRCMRPEVAVANFRWRGLDGTEIPVHWLSRGYGAVRFPSEEGIVNEADLDLVGADRIRGLVEDLGSRDPGEAVLVSNGGDFIFPQRSAPGVLADLRMACGLEGLEFSTIEKYFGGIDWAAKPVVGGEFNSALQGTFTSNIRIKQRNKRQTGRIRALEALAVVLGKPLVSDFETARRLVLKQQFHDIICGTICDAALEDWETDTGIIDRILDSCESSLAGGGSEAVWFNPTCHARREYLDDVVVEAPAFGFGSAMPQEATPVCRDFPFVFESDQYVAEVGMQGFLTGLVSGGRQWVSGVPCSFGELAFQMDGGDLWLNFEGPLSGGSWESSLVMNNADPYDRGDPARIVNRSTTRPTVDSVEIVKSTDDEVIIRQSGRIGFWEISIPWVTETRLHRHDPLIRFRTTLRPAGRHWRLRVAFPTSLMDGTIRNDIPFGVQERGAGEHVAQAWLDWADSRGGLLLIHKGTPAVNVDRGILMMTLFRSVAMEYKCASQNSYGEGIEHVFEYAVLPHGADADQEIRRQAANFQSPLVCCGHSDVPEGGWEFEGVEVSCLRPASDGAFCRMFEFRGKSIRARVRIPSDFSLWSPCDIFGNVVGEARRIRGMVELDFSPWEIQTIRLMRG